MVRTDGRAYAHVITKFSRMGRLPHYLSYGAPSTHALRARVELRYKYILRRLTNTCNENKSLRVEFVEISHVFGEGEANVITGQSQYRPAAENSANQSRLEAVTGFKEAQESFTCGLRH